MLCQISRTSVLICVYSCAADPGSCSQNGDIQEGASQHQQRQDHQDVTEPQVVKQRVLWVRLWCAEDTVGTKLSRPQIWLLITSSGCCLWLPGCSSTVVVQCWSIRLVTNHVYFRHVHPWQQSPAIPRFNHKAHACKSEIRQN